MSTKEYQNKRNFNSTNEPNDDDSTAPTDERFFIVQKHDATRLHFDFRISHKRVLVSWAVPKGPSANPSQQRLAVKVESHPLSYAQFEGVIPKGQYGAGTVIKWDQGLYDHRQGGSDQEQESAVEKGLKKGHLTLILHGQKLKGEYALVRSEKSQEQWLLIKKSDKYADFSFQNVEDFMKETKERKETDPYTQINAVSDRPVCKSEKIFPAIPKIAVPIEYTALPDSSWHQIPILDGIRVLISKRKKRIKIQSRFGMDITKQYPWFSTNVNQPSTEWIIDCILNKEEKKVQVLDVIYAKEHFVASLWFEDRLSYVESIEKEMLEQKKQLGNSITEAFQNNQAILCRHMQSPYPNGVSKSWVIAKMPMSTSQNTSLSFSNLEKVLFKKANLKKRDILEYYEEIHPFLEHHLKDRPLTLNRYPHGIEAQGFYQKDITGYIPSYVKTYAHNSSGKEKTINYMLCQNKETLLYLVNLAAFELNCWQSRINSPNNPDFTIIDLDPSDENSFQEVIELAQYIHSCLQDNNQASLLKTSGATGLHIYLPESNSITYEEAREKAKYYCDKAQVQFPENTSLERSPSKRRGKIYLDFMQNRRSQTMACAYSLRPRTAASISTPLEWTELSPSLHPDQFTISEVLKRVRENGDIWKMKEFLASF